MKKSFLLLLSVIFLISLLVFQSHMKYKEKQDYLTSINRLPKFYYEELHKGKQSSVDLIDGSPFLIIYFDTKCIFCEVEMFKTFHTLVTPSTFVYNKKGIIKSYFKRPVDTKEILAALNDNDN